MKAKKRGLSCLIAGVAASAALATAPAADAGMLLSQVGGSCPAQPLQQPFARWLDPLPYTLVGGGSFESGATGWNLSKASVVSGNETFYVRGGGDSRSLSLPAGATATSPAQCASVDRPVLRFFARCSGGTLLSTLKVDVLFEAPLTGAVLKLPVGAVTANGAWAPSLPMAVLANLTALLPGGQTPVAFQFTPAGAGTWTIDDVYLDPKRH